MITVVTLEHEKADITFATYEGIRIDRQALHIVEGQNCVFVKYGNLVYQKNITILFENEDYILVPSKTTTGENEVKLFDEIVVRGTDLYDGNCSFFVCLFTQICNCLLTSATKTRIITMIVSNLLCRCGYKTVTIVARRRMRLRAASLP